MTDKEELEKKIVALEGKLKRLADSMETKTEEIPQLYLEPNHTTGNCRITGIDETGIDESPQLKKEIVLSKTGDRNFDIYYKDSSKSGGTMPKGFYTASELKALKDCGATPTLHCQCEKCKKYQSEYKPKQKKNTIKIKHMTWITTITIYISIVGIIIANQTTEIEKIVSFIVAIMILICIWKVMRVITGTREVA